MSEQEELLRRFVKYCYDYSRMHFGGLLADSHLQDADIRDIATKYFRTAYSKFEPNALTPFPALNTFFSFFRKCDRCSGRGAVTIFRKVNENKNLCRTCMENEIKVCAQIPRTSEQTSNIDTLLHLFISDALDALQFYRRVGLTRRQAWDLFPIS